MRFDEFMITPDSTVSQAMRQLESSGEKILFVIHDNQIQGVLTDGDIRRYLLAENDRAAGVMAAASRQPLTVSGYHEHAARMLLREKQISCVPMTDHEGRIHALVFQNKVIHREAKPIETPVIIMAGGFGTRLRPYTEILPKPLIPVGSKTITEQILDRFKKFGFGNFILIVNHKRNLIKSYFSEVDTGAQIEFVDEDKPLGTGGGLSFFKGRFIEPVLVTYCDAVIEADYGELLERHVREGNIFTMVCARKTITVPYGVVEEQDGALVSLREKPSFDLLTNTGLYVVSPEFIDKIPDNTFTPITDVVAQCHAEGNRVGIYVIDEECFIDIGQLEDLHSVEGKLL